MMPTVKEVLPTPLVTPLNTMTLMFRNLVVDDSAQDRLSCL